MNRETRLPRPVPGRRLPGHSPAGTARPSPDAPPEDPAETQAQTRTARLATRRGALRPAPVPPIDEGGRGLSLALVFAMALMVPNQFALDVGGVLLTPVRIALLALFVPAILALLARRGQKLYLPDLLYLGYALWTVLCIVINRGAAGAQLAGQFFLESAVIYVLVAASLTRIAQIRALVGFLFLTTAILLVFAIPEALTKRHILLDMFNAVGWNDRIVRGDSIAGERLGLLRVTSIFSHPILFGVFCASSFALVWYLEGRVARRILRAGVIGAATFLSLSSGPMLTMMLQIVAMAVERVTRGMKRRFLKIALLVGLAVAALYTFTNRGIFGIIVLFTLNPDNAFYRRTIWNNGIDDVMRNPVFGMLPETWTRLFWMSPSIDNYWLFQAMQGGIPSVVFLLGSILLLTWRLYRRADATVPPVIAALRRGWAFGVFALVFCGATVHLFDKAQPLFTLVIGLGAAILRVMLDWEARAYPPAPKRGQRPARGEAASGPAAPPADTGPRGRS